MVHDCPAMRVRDGENRESEVEALPPLLRRPITHGSHGHPVLSLPATTKLILLLIVNANATALMRLYDVADAVLIKRQESNLAH